MGQILIAGAGDIGTRVGLQLVDAGHRVCALRRNPAKLPPSLHPIAADLSERDQLHAIPQDVSHVVYAAAADGSSDEHYERAYVTGLNNVLEHCRAAALPIQRIVFISSTAVYAQADGEWVNESSPTEPTGFAGKRTLEAENLLKDAGFDHCILRCGGIYGPGRTRLVDWVESGTASYDPDNPAYTNRIHADDVARAAMFLLFHPQPGRLVLGVDERPATMSEVLHWLASELGAPPPVARSASAGGSARRSASNKRVSSERLRGLGFEFRFPSYREGYTALLQARRQSN